MECDVVKDLIPLYIDECCSEESKKIVAEHIEVCTSCKKLFEEMKDSSDVIIVSETPIAMNKLNDWKASIMQSVLLFFSFAVITIGVALEARTPSGFMNGFWAVNLVIPATGFMLSLANWYFVRLYKNKKYFSDCSFIATLGITICAYIWAGVHYELFAACNFITFSDTIQDILHFNGIGFLLTAVCCVLSKLLSNQYAKMVGKE